MFPYAGIDEYHQALRRNETTCVAAVEFYLSQIRSHQHLNAFVEVYEEEALARAQELDRQFTSEKSFKRLHGVVIALKDVLCYKGHLVTAASKILSGFTSLYTASAVQFLLDEGAIIIGNCNCDEFAMGSTNENSVYGPVLNGLDNSKVPGGSSGGSAVAVQQDMCMLSLGSDTGGSVRQPADFCGIIGLKPGYGTISRYGLIAYASSFDQVGIFGKNLQDVFLALGIMSAYDPLDTTMRQTLPSATLTQGRAYKFAYFAEAFNHPSLDNEIAAQMFEQVSRMRNDGITVDAVPFDLLEYIVPAYYVLTTGEASSNLARYDGVRYGYRSTTPAPDLTTFYLNNRSEGFGKEVKRRIMLGTFVLSTGFYDAYFSKAQQVRQLLISRIEEIFQQYDGILLPCSPQTAFSLGESAKDPLAMYLADIFTVFANLTGVPAIALPLFRHSNGMPFGLQLMAARGGEHTLQRMSQYLMQQNVAV